MRHAIARLGRRDKYDVVFHAPQASALLDMTAESPIGGAEVQVLMLAQALAARGHRVALIVRGDPERLPAEINRVAVLVQAPNRLQRERWGVFARIELMIRTVVALVRAGGNRYVQRSSGHVVGLVSLATRLTGSEFVYSSANVIDFDYGRLEPSRPHVMLHEFGVRRADTIIVQTDEQADLCRETFRRDPTVIKSVAEERPQRSCEAEAFLWAGRAAFYKRPELFVELARRVPEAQFWMVLIPALEIGAALAAEIEAIAKDVENLQLLPPRPRDELGELIARSVAIVNTSDYEGLSNVALEAWSSGVPVLALTHDPDDLIAREDLGYFAEGSLDRLADQAAQMWRERGVLDEFGQRCRSYVRRDHAIEGVVDRWQAALRLRAAVDRGRPKPTRDADLEE